MRACGRACIRACVSVFPVMWIHVGAQSRHVNHMVMYVHHNAQGGSVQCSQGTGVKGGTHFSLLGENPGCSCTNGELGGPRPSCSSRVSETLLRVPKALARLLEEDPGAE